MTLLPHRSGGLAPGPSHPLPTLTLVTEPTGRELLRHALATLAYRAGRALRDSPESFAHFQAAEGVRTPLAILSHIADLIEWALSFARGAPRWSPGAAADWDVEVDRFHTSLAALDVYLASDAPIETPAEKIFQGPIADAFTHVGQLALLRRLTGAPVPGENYARADIVAGRVGPEQPPAAMPFR